MKRIIFMLCALTVCNIASAQKITVSGTVTDDKTLPVIGAVIQEHNGKAVAITDNEGRYSLQVPSDAVLTASCLDFYCYICTQRFSQDLHSKRWHYSSTFRDIIKSLW